jgi:DNA-binding Xre family transcriptional regulator
MRAKKMTETILAQMTKTELSDKLGITRPTLDTRIKTGNWKTSEEFLLRSIYVELTKE